MIIQQEKKKPNWYKADGAPIDGTVREAKKHKGFASVTYILDSVLKQPGLDEWKRNKAIEATASAIKSGIDPDAEGFREAVNSFIEASNPARDMGTRIHAIAEAMVNGETWNDPALVEMLPITLAQLQDFISEHPGVAEERIACTKMKTCGGIDLYDDQFVYDWKSQFVEEGKRKPALPKFQESWTYQLAAYAEILRLKDGKNRAIMSIILSTNPEAQGVFTKCWTSTQQRDGLAVFRAATKIFYISRKYTF